MGLNLPNADGLVRGTPSEAGVDAAAVEAFLDDVAAAGLELHGLMLHRRGRVVAEAWWWPYAPTRPRIMHSLAKSFTACAVGLALAEGRFTLADKVVSFFPERAAGPVDDKLAAMTIEDLLTMRTGHASEVGGALWRGIAGSWIDEFFAIPVVHPPGATYVYTSAASYMLSAILTRTTGQTLHDYLKPRLFAPLGIRGERWDVGPDGLNPGGNGFTGQTADILKLGVLHAQKGVWEGRRLLPEAWVADATRPHANDGRYGYHWVTYPNGAYAALGMFVQMTMVFPQAGATLAINAAIDGSEKLAPLIFRHFPDGFHDRPIAGGEADDRLAERLAGVSAPRSFDGGQAHRAPPEGRFRMDPNPLGVTEIALEPGAASLTYQLTDASGVHRVEGGWRRWREGRTSMPGRDLHHGYALSDAVVVAGAEWSGPDTLRLTWIFAETAFRDTVDCRFDGDRLTVERSVNVNSADRRHPPLTGRRIG